MCVCVCVCTCSTPSHHHLLHTHIPSPAPHPHTQDPRFLASQANEILTAIVRGMSKDEPTQSHKVKLAATKALLNSLEFTKANFEKEVCTLYS